MNTPERDIKAAILIYLGTRPDVVAWNHPTGTAATLTPPHTVIRYGLPGSPDIIGVHAGRAIGIEVKTAIGRQSDQQRRFAARWTAAGGLYVLARSVDDVRRALGAVLS